MAEAAARWLPQEIIRRKRDGLVLEAEEIAAFMTGLTQGTVSGEQAAAFAMAVYWRGMQPAESVALTRAMTASGLVLDWRRFDLPGPVLDKHSTGGIGDTVSLLLAPALAACGAFVPMVSGRGLGHSGGTLDKIEAIPGYRIGLDAAELQAVVARIGCAIVGAGAELAPADARLYAIRDVTATIESIPLITASILSKKRAAGLDALVMDVKTGSGAFMTSLDAAMALARSLCDVAAGAGLRTSALVTDMDQPLGDAAGNGLEVALAVDVLTGRRRPDRLTAVTIALGAEVLVLGGLARALDEGAARIETALARGAAAERFGAMVAALGGPKDFVDRPAACLDAAPLRRDIWAGRPGLVEAIDTRAVGLAVVALGGGRSRPGEAIDPRVGFTALAPLGADAAASPLACVHAASAPAADAAEAALRRAYRIGDAAPQPAAPVLARLEGKP